MRAKERTTRHYETQLKATEDKVHTAKNDAYEAKTRFERHQREQLREHEETERRLTHVLRQAQSNSGKDLLMAKLRHELHQSQLAARSEAEEVKCLQESCGVMAYHSEHATMKGHEIDKTLMQTINDYNTRLHVANGELKSFNQRRDQYQAELLDYRREKYELRRVWIRL